LQLPFENILKADMKVLISFVPYRVNVHVSMLMFVHVTTVVCCKSIDCRLCCLIFCFDYFRF
jgi:hypothetical protein